MYAEPERRNRRQDPRRFHYCGITLLPSEYHRSDRLATKDHVVPVAEGGSLKNNWVWACQGCNSRKAAMTVEEFKSKFSGWIQERKIQGVIKK